MKFSERLRELRKSKGYTQEYLAKIIGITPAAIGLYEQDRREPDNDTLIALAEVFGVSVDCLLGLDEPYNITTPNFDKLIEDVIKDEKINITGSCGIGKSTLLSRSVAYTPTPKEQELIKLIGNSKLSNEKIDVLIDMIKSWK